MMTELYTKYFQKSQTFLYPALGLKKHPQFKPVRTYVAWKSMYKPDDKKLICVYDNPDNEDWKLYQLRHLTSHKMLEVSTLINEGKQIAYIFDMSAYEEDFNRFLKGKYSKFSPHLKGDIIGYYGTYTPEWAYIESFIYPEKYYKHYAKILNVDESVLKERGELCAPYDPNEEKLCAELPDNFVDNLPML